MNMIDEIRRYEKLRRGDTEIKSRCAEMKDKNPEGGRLCFFHKKVGICVFQCCSLIVNQVFEEVLSSSEVFCVVSVLV